MSTKFLILLFTVTCLYTTVKGQALCDSTVPSFIVDLSNDPQGTYVSIDVRREGLCCDNYWPDRCVEFVVTLHPSAVGLIFDIDRGAEPPGALFYTINCGPEIPVGELACLEGPGPHWVTFCKPGANKNIYTIQSIPGRIVPDTATVVEGCGTELGVQGIIPSTIEWTDITSADGSYESLLSCTTGCDSVVFSSHLGLPDYISYLVCGTLENPICTFDTIACDTVTVRILRDLQADIYPEDQVICSNDPGESIDLSAIISGDYEDIQYEWYLNNIQSSNLIGSDSMQTVDQTGYYHLVVYDAAHPYCRRDTAAVSIEFSTIPLLLIPEDRETCAFNEITVSASGASIINWFTATDTLCLGCPTLNWVFNEDELVYVQGINAAGCEMIDSFNVSVSFSSADTIYDGFCEGDDYVLPSGTVVTNGGVYIDSFTTYSGCDSLITIILEEYPTYNYVLDVTICEGEYYYFTDVHAVSDSGYYPFTHNTIHNCDSVVIIHVIVMPTYEVDITASICSGDGYVLPDGEITDSAGHYIDTLLSVSGCDSIVNTHLSLIPYHETFADITICEGTNYTLPDGTVVSDSGSYTSILTSVSGCDSFIYTHVSSIPFFETFIAASICQGQSYTLPDGSVVSSAGNYSSTLISVTGCDSIVHTDLTILLTYESDIDVVICQGQNYTLPDGTIVSNSGNYTTSFTSTQGCDSIINVHISFSNLIETSFADVMCQGQNYTLPDGTVVSDSGSYISTFVTSTGCDSIVHIHLSYIPTTIVEIKQAICVGQQYTLPDGTIVSDTGSYVSTLVAVTGCDSIIYINLAFYPSIEIHQEDAFCQGQNYTLPDGSIVSDTGSYNSILSSVKGCDSLIHTHLSFLPMNETIIEAAICEGEDYLLPDGSFVSDSGTYISTFINALGCDSIIQTHLSVHSATEALMTGIICPGENFILPDGSIASDSGTYVTVITSSLGCDSIVTTVLNLGILSNTTVLAEICMGENYVLPNGEIVNSSGTYLDTLTNQTGCDSIVTTVLTVLPSTVTVNAITICEGDSYTLPDGSVITAAGELIDTLFTGFGCDSVIQTLITVLPQYQFDDVVTICEGDSVILPDGSIVFDQGNYTTSFTTANGCDSIYNTQVNVVSAIKIQIIDTICAGEAYVLPNGQIEYFSGTYVDSFVNYTGCDSIITTTLTLLPSVIHTIKVDLCEGESYTLPNGVEITASNVQLDTTFTQYGCDSVIRTIINVYPTYDTTIDHFICQGENFELPDGQIVTDSGSYISELTTISGCDSTITTHLQFYPSYDIQQEQDICAGESFMLPGGEIVSDSGSYITPFVSYNGCDSIITTHLVVIPSFENSSDQFICEGQSFELPNGQIVSDTGFYISGLTANNGCDSTITTHLKFYPAYDIQQPSTICEGESFTLPDGEIVSDSGYYVTPLTSFNGCDSIITTHLRVLPNFENSSDQFICEGQNFELPDGQIVSDTGVYTSNLTAYTGCDSTITTHLKFYPDYDLQQEQIICIGESYTLPNGEIVSDSGSYSTSLVSFNGCDSIITTLLRVLPSFESSLEQFICAGQSFELQDGQVVSDSGVYISNFTAYTGCDSTLITHLKFYPTYDIQQPSTICAGESFTLPDGEIVSDSGSYITPFISFNGCDSIITTHLRVLPNFENVSDQFICEGQSFELPNGQIVTDSGSYVSELTAISGCDSTITTHLKFYPDYDLQQEQIICTGESYTLPNGEIVSDSGSYSTALVSFNGCDSIITTHLRVLPNFDNSSDQFICEGQSFELPDGQVVTDSGSYVSELTAMSGCDSIVTIHLKFLSTSNIQQEQTICAGESYTLPNGEIVSDSGSYITPFVSYNGCDSIITTHLRVLPNLDNSSDQFICEGQSFELPNGQIVTDSGAYTSELTAISGCDSTIITHLKFYPDYDLQQEQIICTGESYTLPNGEIVSDSGSYITPFVSFNGCDSIITTHLRVLPNFESTIERTICDGESIILPNGDLVSESGTYIQTFTSSMGCDSTFRIILNTLPSYYTNQKVVTCLGESVTLPDGSVVSDSGSYVSSFTSVAGCDSIINTQLIINPVFDIDVDNFICEDEFFTLPDGSIVSDSGSYTTYLTSSTGCDSFVTTHLSVKYYYKDEVSYHICDTDTIFIPNGPKLYQDTSIEFSFPTTNYCDSVIVFNVTQSTSDVTNINASICNGDFIEIDDYIFSQVGVFIIDLTNQNDCDSTVIIEIKEADPFIKTIDTSLCQGMPLLIAGTVFEDEGDYLLEYENDNGCDSNFIIHIDYLEPPTVLIRDDTTIFQGDEVLAYLEELSSGTVSIEWFIDNNLVATDVESFLQAYYENTSIQVIVTDQNNCKAINEFQIYMEEACPDDLIFVPNIITPNNDNANDVFDILNPHDVIIKEVAIFNRWGELVYEAPDFSDPWDGTFRGQSCDPGVFTYYIKGNCTSGNMLLKKGNITLIR
ncbi:MAG: gliding motility-associated C-terminal domain-containing protein [Chitinophagales bacterium]